MDIGRSFAYIFEDSDWVKKVILGGVFRILPIVGFIADGYWLTQTKNIYEGRELPMPEWDNYGGYFMKGLYNFVAQFVYTIPVLLLACCAFIVPIFVLTPGSSTNARGTSQPGAFATLSFPLLICGSCVLFLYMLVLLVFLPALTTRYAITEQFGSFFQFGAAWQMIRSNMGNYAIAVLVFLVAAIVASLVGGIACGIGALFTGFWAQLVGAHLFGNFAKGAPQPTMA